MATVMMIIIVVLLALTIIPWIGDVSHTGVRRTDLMAGDEGED